MIHGAQYLWPFAKVNHDELMLALSRASLWPVNVTNCSSFVTGSGASNLTENRATITTGATASSYAHLRYSSGYGFEAFGAPGGDGIVGTKGFLSFLLSVNATTANGTFDIGLGYWHGDSDPAPIAANRVWGFQLQGLDLHGFTSDGTTLTVQDLSTALVVGEIYRLVVDWDEAGNVNWSMVNASGVATPLGTSAGGPTDNTSNTNNSFMMGVKNNADAAVHSISIASPLIKI